MCISHVHKQSDLCSISEAVNVPFKFRLMVKCKIKNDEACVEMNFFANFKYMTTKNHIEVQDPAEFTERFINQTNQSVFLTGKAGTGKTTLLKKIISTTHKNAVIVAPTGIAALNAGGVTIHSFFQLPFSAFIPDFGKAKGLHTGAKIEDKQTLMGHFKMNRHRQQIIRNLELLIIDEVSMLRADLLDAIDWSLRNVRKINRPFGGVQVLFIGDLLQLPPVVKPEEWNELRHYYRGIHFFNAHVIQEQQPLYIELSTIYRQQDQEFICVLNHLRDNHITEEDVRILNQYVKPEFDPLKAEGYITLTTHNSKADEMNSRALSSLEGGSHFYEAEITGDFPTHLFPIDPKMELKVGAQIMFIKNDISFEKNFYNGKMGKIASLGPEEITVYFPEEKRTISVQKYEWNNIRYKLDESKGEIREEVLGTFVHYPIKLAWAITVHKSQGLTFDKAVLDVSDVFAPGQAYVALSRLRSLEGLVLLKPMRMNGLSNDTQVVGYADNKADEALLKRALEVGTHRFLHETLTNAFDWYELSSAWNIHEASYKIVGPKSEKGKNKTWVIQQTQSINNLSEPAKKFCSQLDRCFSGVADMNFVHERVQAAYAYFFKTLDQVLTSNLKKIAELKRVRKTKQYAEELEELDSLLTETILKLKKARLLVEAVNNGRDITREVIRNTEIENYKLAKIASLQQDLRQQPGLLDMEDDEDLIVVKSLKRSPKEKKEPKKSTYEQTLELVERGMSIEEIARVRQFSVGTINTHLVNLIKAEKMELEDVMPAERIAFLASELLDAEGKSLTEIKEKLGDEVTYDELKLFQASKMR